MLRAKLDQRIDGVHARGLCKRARNDFQRLGKSLNRELFAPAHGDRVLAQAHGELHLDGPAANHDAAVLDRARNRAYRVHEGALRLVDHVLGASANEYGDALGLLAFLHEDHLFAGNLALFDCARETKVPCRQVVESRGDAPAGRARELLHVALLHAPDRRDARLGQVVLGDVVNALLAEQHLRAARLEFFRHYLEHLFFLLQERGHLFGRIDVDARIRLRLLDFEGGVHQRNPRVLDALGHTRVHDFLVDQHAVYQRGLGDVPALLLLDFDVILVNGCLSVALFRDLLDGRNDQARQQGLGLDARRDRLGAHADSRDLLQLLDVVNGNLLAARVQLADCARRGALVAADYGGRVNVLVEQLGSLLEHLSRQHDSAGGSVAHFLVLRLRDFDEHLGGGVLHVHLLENRRPVVRNHDVPHLGDHHLVHAARAQRALDRAGDRVSHRDVRALGVPAENALAALGQDQNLLPAQLSLLHIKPTSISI